MKNHIFLAACLFCFILVLGCAKKLPDNPINNFIDQNMNTDLAKPVVDQNNDALQPKQEVVTPKKDEPVVPSLGPDIDKCLLDNTPIKADLCIIGLAKTSKSDMPCTKISKDLKERCYYEAGIASLNKQICGKLTETLLKDNCFEEVGKQTKDADSCRNVSDISKRDDCYSKIPDFEICKTIFEPAKRDGCYFDLANSLKDIDVCQKISARYDSGSYKRDTCYKNLLQTDSNGEFCFNYMSDPLKSECFSKAKNNPQKPVDCSALADENAAQSCYMWVATATGETEKCYDLPYSIQAQCVDKIVISNPSAKGCANIQKSARKNDCFYNLAKQLTNLAICKEIDGNSAMRDDCFSKIAISQGKENDCFEISKGNPTGLEKCVTKIALASNDNRKCERIQRDAAYVSCYMELALKNNLPEVCLKSTRDTMKTMAYSSSENCFNAYAIKTKDPNICEKIPHSRFVADCKRSVTIEVTCINGDGTCDTDVCTYNGDPAGNRNYDTDCTKSQVEQAIAEKELNKLNG